MINSIQSYQNSTRLSTNRTNKSNNSTTFGSILEGYHLPKELQERLLYNLPCIPEKRGLDGLAGSISAWIKDLGRILLDDKNPEAIVNLHIKSIEIPGLREPTVTANSLGLPIDINLTVKSKGCAKTSPVKYIAKRRPDGNSGSYGKFDITPIDPEADNITTKVNELVGTVNQSIATRENWEKEHMNDVEVFLTEALNYS